MNLPSTPLPIAATVLRTTCLVLLASFAWAAGEADGAFVCVGASVQQVTDGITGTPLEVRVDAFLMGREEVSQQAFQQLMGRNPSRVQNPALPVDNVTWREAIDYCNRRSLREGLIACYGDDGSWNRTCTGYRLPTEAEWLAALGSSAGIPAEQLADAHLLRGENRVAVVAEQSVKGSLPVERGALFGAGLRNQIGNVWEWCWDRFHAARIVDAVDNPQGPQTGNERVIRGGSYLTRPNEWNKGFRSSMPPSGRSPYTGFRLARSLPHGGESLPARLYAGVVDVQASGDETPKPANELRLQWMEVLGEPKLPPTPVQAIAREHLVEPAWRGRLLDLTLEPGLPCRALLMLPATAQPGPLPVVVVPFYDVDTPAGRDLGGRSAMPASPRALGHLAVQHGMAALVVRWSGENDAPGYLEVVAELERRHPGVTGLGYWVWQAKRIADWLQTQPEIDPARIGIAGHSLGGKMALYAASFEPRYRAVVSSEPGIALEFSNYGDPWYLGERIRLLPEGADHHELLHLMAPRPFLLIAGESADGAKSLPMLARGAAAYPAEESAGTPARRAGIAILNHGTGHSPTPESVASAMAWLRDHLSNSRAR
ncbi:MAG: SUMF1/EgtB/PvdO family nonheme iron enzyme [Bryobacterales bacterium]|nr:SUMF1/EgtB/PvdO family nonheme iron enzyme [Bryobacterales bacterium]